MEAMSDAITEEELADIERRARVSISYGHDVLRLIAEIRRLQAEVTEMKEEAQDQAWERGEARERREDD
jgi:uncharacterized protein (UPF0371 family)